MNIFFDVQGTLICGGIPRPHAREVFAELAAASHDVYLWSSGGTGYATSAAEILGVEDLVFGCCSKFAPPPVTVDYAVDDHQDLVDRYGGYAIVAFDGNPEDRELLKVVEALRQAGGLGSGP